MKTCLSLLASILFAFLMSYLLVVSLPGTFASDEVRMAGLSQELLFLPTLKAYLVGDWGFSWRSPELSVFQLVMSSMQMTLGLQILSFLLILFSSLVLSYFMITRSKVKSLLEPLLSIGASLPMLFWLPVLILIFCFQLAWLPHRYDQSWVSWILPLVGLVLRPLCVSTQILYDGWSHSTRQDYFRTARAKGLSFRRSLLVHGLKNSVVTFSAQMLQMVAHLLTGSVLIETLFSWPGLGYLFTESLQNRDLPVLLGLVFVMVSLFFAVQTLLSSLHRFFEPRLRV